MIRVKLAAAVLLSATLSVSAQAQIAPAIPRAEPPPPPEPAAVAPAPPVSPPAYAPPAAPPAAVVAPAAAPPVALEDLTSAVGFGIGVIPNAELAGTTGAVAIKYWISDELAVAPLLIFAYDKPRGADAGWHVRPEALLLYVPFASRWTRFEVGGGLAVDVNRPASTTNADGMSLQSDTHFRLAVPIQAGVEHFFTRWLSLGIAARADLFAYSEDGDYHEVSFTIDSTSLLGQLFFYTD